MRLIKIVRAEELGSDMFSRVTYKTWLGREVTKVCLTSRDGARITIFAESGKWIKMALWGTISTFLDSDNQVINF